MSFHLWCAIVPECQVTSKKALPQAAHFHIEQEKLTMGLQSFMVPSLTNCNPGTCWDFRNLVCLSLSKAVKKQSNSFVTYVCEIKAHLHKMWAGRSD